MPTISDTDKAWAAGIIEGEGSIRITPPGARNTCSLFVSVTSTDRDMLEHLSAHGGSIGAESKRPGRKAYQRWTIVSRQAGGFLEAIRPFCRVARIVAKVDLALEFQAQKAHATQIRDRDAYDATQMAYHDQMKALNVRGGDESCGKCHMSPCNCRREKPRGVIA